MWWFFFFLQLQILFLVHVVFSQTGAVTQFLLCKAKLNDCCLVRAFLSLADHHSPCLSLFPYGLSEHEGLHFSCAPPGVSPSHFTIFNSLPSSLAAGQQTFLRGACWGGGWNPASASVLVVLHLPGALRLHEPMFTSGGGGKSLKSSG